MSALRLDGKVALVTGGGRGLGRSYALLLASCGAKVVVNDPGVGLEGDGADKSPALAVVDEIIATGGVAVANFDTVATPQGAQAMIDQAVDHFGAIDIVVNNAGNFLEKHDFAQSSVESFDRIMTVHVDGTINVVRAAWPHMIAQRSGRIINTGSHVGYLGNGGQIEYATAKAAIHGFTKTLALESAQYGIAVNMVAPAGLTRPNTADPQIAQRFANDPSFATDLVAPTVVWLAHDCCTANGESFGVMAGTTTRILIAETKGYFSRQPMPEGLRDHADALMGAVDLAAANLDFGAGLDGEMRGMALVQKFHA